MQFSSRKKREDENFLKEYLTGKGKGEKKFI